MLCDPVHWHIVGKARPWDSEQSRGTALWVPRAPITPQTAPPEGGALRCATGTHAHRLRRKRSSGNKTAARTQLHVDSDPSAVWLLRSETALCGTGVGPASACRRGPDCRSPTEQLQMAQEGWNRPRATA